MEYVALVVSIVVLIYTIKINRDIQRRNKERDIEEFNKQISDAVEQFSSLVKNYKSTPEDFDTLFSSTFTKRQQQINKIWKHRSDMLTNIKPEEWKEIIAGVKSAAQEK